MIHRIDLKSSKPMNNWHVVTCQSTLSTLKSGNLLVTCPTKHKLIEFTPTGQLVREIFLRPGITYPTHAIPMDNDRFLVCHFSFNNNLHRVCLIDNKGQLIKSYGGAQGSGPGQLYNPCHLVYDANGFCLVVESGGAKRVVMLNEELEFVEELIPTSMGLKDPKRLCLDKKTKRLYVADYNSPQIAIFGLFCWFNKLKSLFIIC